MIVSVLIKREVVIEMDVDSEQEALVAAADMYASGDASAELSDAEFSILEEG